MKITRPNNLWLPESVSLNLEKKKKEKSKRERNAEEKLLKLTLIEKQLRAILFL